MGLGKSELEIVIDHDKGEVTVTRIEKLGDGKVMFDGVEYACMDIAMHMKEKLNLPKPSADRSA